MKFNWRSYTNLAGLFLLCIISTVLTQGTFVEPDNLINVARQVSVNGILAVGMTLVILIGGIDLSIGSVVAFTGIIAAMSLPRLGVWPGLGLTLAAGLFIGAWNGALTVWLRMPSFIITLGMMTMARGGALVLSGGSSISIEGPFTLLGKGALPPLPALVLVILCGLGGLYPARRKPEESGWGWTVARWMVVTIVTAGSGYVVYRSEGLPVPVLIFAGLAALLSVTLRLTTFGRHLYALGGNREAARLSGISINKLTIAVFTLMGGIAALAGSVLAARVAAGTPTAGNMFELDAIASVVIGGTSLMGGRGTIEGSIIGAFIIGILNNMLSLLNVNPFYQLIAKGVIIIAAVALDLGKREG